MQQYMLHPFFVCYRCSVNLLQEVFFRRKNLLQGLQNCFILNTFAI